MLCQHTKGLLCVQGIDAIELRMRRKREYLIVIIQHKRMQNIEKKGS